MDLGLSALTDDQAISLLQEVLGELATRDPLVRRLTQKAIITESEKLDALKAALPAALAKAKEEYLVTLRQDVEGEVRKAVQSGELRIDGQDEAREILQAHKLAVGQLALEAKFALGQNRNHGKRIDFVIDDNSMAIKIGGFARSSMCMLSDKQEKILKNAFEQCMELASGGLSR